MRKLFIIILIAFSSSLFSQIESYHSTPEKITCQTCHECTTPTRENPCLIDCPRERMELQYIPADRTPKMIELRTLSDKKSKYGKVDFSHRAHAEMSNLAGGCVMCHHFNPPGEVLNCSECHSAERQREDISIPDLKGSYHRLCIDCHEKWSGSTDCTQCHLESQKQVKSDAGKRHVKVAAPVNKVYHTGFDDLPIVTFFHNDHTNIYGFECGDCHSDESCVKCHNKKPVEKSLRKIEPDDAHSKCSKCHDTDDNCENCHSVKEKEPFNHYNRTGFSLKKYHSDLSCSKCHKTPGKFTGLKLDCNKCHSGWTYETFDHKVTGLELNEIHVELECENCHLERQFYKKPVCSECHDEISYPDNLPGERVK